MSTNVGSRLTEPIRSFFDGTDLAGKVGAGFVLITTDADGSPRPCMLSAGEVWADGDRALRLALWRGTRTSENLARGSRALFCFVGQHDVCYVHGRARRLRSPTTETFDCFELVVDHASTDEHPGMPVTSGIRFEVANGDRPGVVSAWTRQLEILRRAE